MAEDVRSAVAPAGGRYTSTGMNVFRTILSATLPKTNRVSPPRPCVATAMRSIFSLRAASTMEAAASPTTTCV